MKKNQHRAGGEPAAVRPLMCAGVFGALALAATATAVEARPFDGPYVGADVGYEDSGRLDHGGVTYGAFAGYDLKVGSRFVVGAEGRIGDSSIRHELVRSGPVFTTAARSSIGRHVGGAVRVGFLAGARTLLYARGGWENVKVRATTTRTETPPTTNPPVVADFGFDDDTSVFGAGVEHRVTDHFRVRLGYDYAENFDRHQLRVGIVAGF
jgi:outer membrane immunogenic protein